MPKQDDSTILLNQESSSFFRELRTYVARTYRKEIQDDIELEKKYQISHTQKEVEYRKKLQERFKFLQAQKKKVVFNATRKTWGWLRKYYINLQVKNSVENYEYSKEMKKSFFKIILKGMAKGIGYTFIFFLCMRLIKHKGKKDLQYLFFINMIFSCQWVEYYMYSYIWETKLPITKSDLDRRKELIEEFVYAGYYKTPILIEEIKKISKYYVKEKVDYSFVTALGQNVNLTSLSGRLYLTCDNYYEVFGYNKKNALLKINNLDIMNVRDREIIFGLFKFYDELINKYIIKNNVNVNETNAHTEILQNIVKDKGISQSQLEAIKKTNIIKNVDFNKIEINNDENKVKTDVESVKPDKDKKFYI